LVLNRREQLALLMLTVALVVGSAAAVVDYYRPRTLADLHVVAGAAVPQSAPEAAAGAALAPLAAATDPPAGTHQGKAPAVARSAGRSGRSVAASAQEGAQPLDLNLANGDQLQRLPGIGPALAARVLAYRQEHGPFLRLEDLQQVRGIGPRTVARLAGLVMIGRSGSDSTTAVAAGSSPATP
jgi:competence protein ComEA